LETPGEDENALVLDIDDTVANLIEAIVKHLNASTT
jgi:gluconate kinase